jgi:hypothetical protein
MLNLRIQLRCDYELFFVDTEGTNAASGMSQDLDKALLVLSSVATLSIVMGQNRLHEGVIADVHHVFQLQCMRGSEVSSAIVLVCRDVGFDDPAPASLAEMEQRRRQEDAAGFALIRERFSQHEFTPNTLCVLLQPQTHDSGEEIEFGPEGYMNSIKDLGYFIANACCTRQPMGFRLMHSLLLSVALQVQRMTEICPLNMRDIIENLWISTATEFAQSITREFSARIPQEIGQIPLQAFPFDRSANPRIEEALQRFAEQCNSFSRDLLESIGARRDALQNDIRGSLTTEWERQIAIRRQFWIDSLTRNVAATGERLAGVAASRALAQVSGLLPQQTLGYTSSEQFADPAIQAALTELRDAGRRIHLQCEILVPQPLQVARARIQENVRTTVDPCWRQKIAEAHRWQAAQNEEARRTIEREAQERCNREQRAREEAQRQLERANQQAIQEQNRRDRERKSLRPETLTEIVEIRGTNGDFDDPLWIHSGGMGALPYKVTSWSKRESRLALANGLVVRARKVRVTRVWDPSEGATIWTVTAELGGIGCYFDGATMEIVFERDVNLGEDEAIYIDIPPNTDIANIDVASSGFYMHWREGRSDPKYQVIMGVSGSYARGPRLQLEHR